MVILSLIFWATSILFSIVWKVSIAAPTYIVQVAQPCLTLCDPMDYTVHGILQARKLEWVSFPFSRGSSQPRDWTQVFHIAGRWASHFFYQLNRKGRRELSLCHFHMILWSNLYFINSCCCSVAKLCLTLCYPVDCSPPGSSVLSSRILKWVAVLFSRGSSSTRDWTRISYIGRQILSPWARETPTDFIWGLNAIDLTMTIYVYTCIYIYTHTYIYDF